MLTRIPLRTAYRSPVTSLVALGAAAVSVFSWSGHDVGSLIASGALLRTRPWTLISSIFPHANLFHLAFNLYWWWIFGTKIEAAWGSAKLLAITLVLAVTSSAAEVALYQGGIGLSGVDYGLFTLLWVVQSHDPRLTGTVSRRTASIFVVWFFACIAMTAAGLWNIGNFAHGAGALIGALLGLCIVTTPRRRSAWYAALLLTCTLSVVGATVARPWVNISPKSIRGYEALARGDYAKAAALLEAALRQDPKDATALVNLGTAYNHLEKQPEALDCYKQAVQIAPSKRRLLAPSIDWILTDQARAAIEANDLAQASKLIDEALKWKRDDGYAWRLRGTIYFRQKNFDDAIKAYETAKAFSTADSYSREQFVHDVVAVEMHAERYDGAAERLRAELAANPANAEFWFLLGQCLEATTSKDDALEAYEHAAGSPDYGDRAEGAAAALREK